MSSKKLLRSLTRFGSDEQLISMAALSIRSHSHPDPVPARSNQSKGDHRYWFIVEPLFTTTLP